MERQGAFDQRPAVFPESNLPDESRHPLDAFRCQEIVRPACAWTHADRHEPVDRGGAGVPECRCVDSPFCKAGERDRRR